MLLKKELKNVREELEDNVYIAEALRVLPVGGLRSAIGSYWNAVVDDLRNKIIHRSLDLFNAEMQTNIKRYEDFQDHVSDFNLVEGAYKVGVLSWEGRKMIQQARETRNVFDGHPKSSDPSMFKVLDFISDCNRYVLSQDPPPTLIKIEEYLQQLDSGNFNKNSIAVEQAFGDLPVVYRSKLANMLYSSYTNPNASLTLRANIEFCMPILWSILSREERVQIARRVDKDFVDGNAHKTAQGTNFIALVGGVRYLSNATRKFIYLPLVEEFERSLDDWAAEGSLIQQIRRLGTNIPIDLVPRLVKAMTATYVGYKGSSPRFNRTAFYSDAAAPVIVSFFEEFDEFAVDAFIHCLRDKDNHTLRTRLKSPAQLMRLRTLGQVLLDKGGQNDEQIRFLELLTNTEKTNELFNELRLA